MIEKMPRARIAHLPTPLDEAPNLSQALGGPRILIKRDDMTGLAFGGNKTRKLEFLMGDAIQRGADSSDGLAHGVPSTSSRSVRTMTRRARGTLNPLSRSGRAAASSTSAARPNDSAVAGAPRRSDAAAHRTRL